MSSAGLSREWLGRMHDVMAGHVERGDVPGLVTLLSRRGEVHVDAVGNMAFAGGNPMRRDTIFRVSSMTKPVVAAATMILVEECALRLDEPVDWLLPELANRQVLTRIDGPLDDTVPANRQITLRDLLTFRWGFGIVMAPPDMYPIQRAMSEQQLGQGPPSPTTPPAPGEWMRLLGTLPLMHQPGEGWMYHTGSDVLGVLIARASGQPLETFLRERIFEPLAMHDTSFSVPAAKLGRLPASYETDAETGALVVYDGAKGSQWSRPPAFPSGAGGLVSTVDDFLAFGQMMLNKGMHGNERIISGPSIDLMTTNQLTSDQQQAAAMFIGDNSGWGFGMSIVTRRDDVSAVPGRFGWDGGLGTSWSSDPNEDLVAILMTQRLDGPIDPGIRSDFRTSVYRTIND